MTGRKLFVSMVVGAAAMLLSSAALADEECTEASGGDGYGYCFNDDVLSSGVVGVHEARITIRDSVVRRTLIRPRTHFVPEMLKSVELI